MAVPATKNRLGGRLAVCQVAGTVAGLMVAIIAGRLLRGPVPPTSGSQVRDIAFLALGALAINVPFYAATVLILHAFTKSILAYPIAWCIGIPGLLLVAALVAFPPVIYGGIFWIALIPLCASFAGLTFVWWQAKSPLIFVG
ncbi:MAG: hypothetical protein JWN69_2593 [Alphaproteobacteria bacterium]|nr:hypothetical protein [Alphaproteobacteria bacterium]